MIQIWFVLYFAIFPSKTTFHTFLFLKKTIRYTVHLIQLIHLILTHSCQDHSLLIHPVHLIYHLMFHLIQYQNSSFLSPHHQPSWDDTHSDCYKLLHVHCPCASSCDFIRRSCDCILHTVSPWACSSRWCRRGRVTLPRQSL